MVTAVDLHTKTLPILEGVTTHPDLKKINTLSHGIVNDAEKHPEATKRNIAAAKEVGLDLNNLKEGEAEIVANKISSNIHKKLSEDDSIVNDLEGTLDEGDKTLGERYKNLPVSLKVLAIDAMYNTGLVYKDLVEAATKYKIDKTEDTLYSVIRESRRLNNKAPHKGLDNRIAKLTTMLGIIPTPNDVTKYGLDMADVEPGDTKAAKDFYKLNKPDIDTKIKEESMKQRVITKETGEEGFEGTATLKPLPLTTTEQTNKMLEDEVFEADELDAELLSDAMGDRLETQQTGDNIVSNFFSGLIDFNSDDSDEVFEADELDAELSSDQDYQNLRRGGEVEANFVDDNKENDKADPPPGATPEEVADDIPAMLSEGEYVLPANVVRYIGLERITDMHKGVLHEIQQMEDLGIIQNVDEDGKPENDDDEMTFIEPKEDMMKGTMIIASKPDDGLMCPPGFASGGEINRNVEINRDINISNLRDTIATQRNDNKEMVETYDKDLGLIKYSIDGDPLAIMSPYFLNDYIKLSSLDSDHDQFGQDVADMEAAQKDKDQMSEAAEVSQNDMDEAAAAAEKEAAIGMDDDATSQATAAAEKEAEAEAAEAAAESADMGDAEIATGGLMNRKSYAVGGAVNADNGVNYNIAGVGQVGGNLTQSAVNQIKDTIEKPRTYEQIKAGTFNDTPEFDASLYNYGDKGEQILDSKQKTKKEKRELVVPDLNAGSPENPKFNDSELETILRMSGADATNWTSMMYDFQHDQLGNNYGGAGVGNGSSLHALSTKRKLFKDGVKDTDIPEGSTNRDMLKSVFFNMIDDFGYDDPTGGYERQSNAPSQIEKLVKADPQTIYDNKEYSDTYKEAIKYLDLDGAADPTVLTHALNQMDTKGDGYNSAPRKTLPRSLMGSNTYVEGVGYVN